MPGQGRFRISSANPKYGVFVFSDGSNTHRVFSKGLAEELLRRLIKGGLISVKDRAETLSQIKVSDLPYKLTDNDLRMKQELLDPHTHFVRGESLEGVPKYGFFFLEDGTECPPIFSQDTAKEVVNLGIAQGLMKLRDRAKLLAEIEASGIALNEETLQQEVDRLKIPWRRPS